MTRLFFLAAVGASSIALSQDAGTAEGPKPSVQEILTRMDAAINGFADQMMEVRFTVVDVDGSKKAYDMTLYQKGQKRMIQFTSGEMKGMATLVEDRESVHVYLPGFKKVRKVAAHNMNQSMAGSDLTSEDMAQVSWLDWNAALEREDEASWWLALTPKAGANTEYGKIVHRVLKKGYLQAETHYFNKAGEEVKRFINSDPTDFHGSIRAKNIVVSDPRSGHRTELEVKDFKVNQGLKDELFTVRQLQWGK